MTKDTAKEQTEAYAKSIEGIKGLTHKIEYKDDYLTEKLTIDFSKADIEELQSKQLLQTSGNQKADYISYKETAKLLEKAGYKEVKDGKKVTVYEEVEKSIQKDKPSRLQARRQILAATYVPTVRPAEAAGRKKNTKKLDLAKKLFEEIAPKYENRHGGYTRIVKVGLRKGDAAMEVLLELV